MSCFVIFLGRLTKNHEFSGLSPFNLTINRTMSRDKILDFVMIAKKSEKKVRLKMFRFFWSGSSGFGSVSISFQWLSPTSPSRGAATTQGVFLLEKSSNFGYFLLFRKIDHTGRGTERLFRCPVELWDVCHA